METSEAMELENNARIRGAGYRRILAIVLSLAAPGAGHFLMGRFRRGVAWALGLIVLGLTLLFTIPVSLATFVLGVVIVLVGRVATAIDTARLAPTRPSWGMVLVAWGALLVFSVLFSLLVDEPLRAYYKAHYARAFTIPSGGMEPTLLVGDYILTDNSVYRSRTPQRGDIVVFKYPQDEKREFIKRIVALPGEQVLIRGHQVYVNGNPLQEPYIKANAVVRADPGSCGYAYGCEPTVVPPDSYFVVGDNRDNSQDSRYWGFVKREKVIGRAFAIYWSWDGERQWPRFDRLGRTL